MSGNVDVNAFRTVRVVDQNGFTTNIIADQSEDSFTLEAGSNVSFSVVEDRLTISTTSPIGFSGSVGFRGSQGFQGSQGDRGYTGSQGERGFIGSYGYTGSIGFSGSQGDRGNLGFTGSQGPQGNAGLPSDVPGPIGFSGSVGVIGFTGSQGVQGNVGNIGVQGTRGPLGFTGSQGVQGFSGSVGDIGFTGSQGFTGSTGYDGSRGQAGYAGSKGFTGSKGIQGIQGVQGSRGYTGSRGNTGPIGETGYSGSRGFVGSTGYTGSRGPIGPMGQGIRGFTGSQGSIGFTGSQGGPPEAFRTFRTQNPDGTTSIIIADQPEDVMTFVAAKGITIDFNEATDTIIFGGTGEGGTGGGSANLSIINNDPVTGCSFIAYNNETGVLEYTPYDTSIYAQVSDLYSLYDQSTDYTNVLIQAEQEARILADEDIYTYVNESIQSIENDLLTNVTVIVDSIDEANVYLQGLIQTEANLRFNADIVLQDQIDVLTGDAGNILIDLDANVTMLQQEIQDVDANSIARDNALQSNIDVTNNDLDQEILDRIAGDQLLQTNLDTQVGLINSELVLLDQGLQDEANIRANTDAVLVVGVAVQATRNDQQDGEIEDLDIRVEALENRVVFDIRGEADLTELGNINTRLPVQGEFIPLMTGNVVTDQWNDVGVILLNTTDEANLIFDLSVIKIDDDIIFNYIGLEQSASRYNVLANVEVKTGTWQGNVVQYAEIQVDPVSYSGVIMPGDVGGNVHNDSYSINYYPHANVEDLPNYDYVDTQDNRRVLKTGDTMTGALTLYNDPQLDLEAATKRYADNKVSKTGGDSMEGPLNISTQPGTGSRDSRRINTLGIYSNSDSSSLQLGTTVTKIYVGNNDTSFNGPIKVSEISDRGAGINIDATLKFNQHTDLLDIMPNNGTTQNINLFAGSNADATTVKVNVNGATFKNALEFESGPSSNKEVVLRIDSNKGLKARNLNMDNTKITNLADPVDPDDVTNKAYVDDAINNVEGNLTTFVEKAGDTMTGKLTTQQLEAQGGILLNSPDRNINAEFGVPGKLQYHGVTRLQWGNEYASVLGSLNISDGINQAGTPATGQIDMNNRFIENLANPTDSQHAATKYYVDEAVADAGAGGDFIKANGDTDITSETTITLKNTKLNIKSENSGSGFQIKRSDGQTLFYSFGNDMRLVNNDANNSNSILSRVQLDARYLNQDGISNLTQTTTIKANSNALFYIQNGANNINNFFKVLNYSGTELFGIDGDGMVRVPRTPTRDNNVANKKYVDDQVANSSSGGVELYGSSSPPASKDRGTMLMTTTNNLYIYV